MQIWAGVSHSPGADVAGVSRSPGADVAGVSRSPGADVAGVSRSPPVQVDSDGNLALPTGPGLGVVIDEAKVRQAAVCGHEWRDREWELSDGTPTTW